MAKTKNKRDLQAKNNEKLKTLNNLNKCKVVLHNIALDKDLVQLYQLRFSEKKAKKLEHSSPCINTSKNSSNNVWILKENVREDNTENETSRLTRSHLKSFTKKINKECKNIEFLDNVPNNHKLIQLGITAQKQQLKHDTNIKSFPSKSNETSSTSSYICCSHTQKIISISNKKHCSNKKPSIQKERKLRCKRKLQFNESDASMESMKTSSDNKNHLDEKNFTDCNRKMQEISNESIKQYNLPIINVLNGAVCSVRLEQCDKTQNSKAVCSNIINTDIENKISEISEDIKTDFKYKNINYSNKLFTIHNIINRTQDQKEAITKSSNKTLDINSTTQATSASKSLTLNVIPITVSKITDVIKMPDLLTTHNKKQYTNETNNKRTKSLPKITGNHILPKGTVKIIKVNASDKSLQNSVSNDTNSSTKQVSYINDTLESTNILKEKEYHVPEVDRSSNRLKISGSTSAFNNNINLKNKNIDNNELHSSEIDRENVDSLVKIKSNIHNDENTDNTDSIITEICKSCILNHQKQFNRLNNDEEYKNNIQDNKKHKISSDENILNNKISNLVSENCNANRSLILINKKEVIKQNRKRIAEENTIKLDNKRKRLNRTLWLQNNVTHTKSLNSEEFNDFPSITTTESNISEETISFKKIDLREYLNKKESKSSKLSTFKSKFDNTNSVESEQIDLNNKNDTIISTSTTKNEKFYKRFSFEKEPTFNKTLYNEKDIQTNPVCNNHIHSTFQSTSKGIQHSSQTDTSIHENIQEKNMNSQNEDDDDDCISLFAESFDTNFCENITKSNEQNKSNKSLHSDVPYIMTASSFNKYMKQNATEFDKEYAKYVKDNIETSNKINKTHKTEKVFNNQSRQMTYTDCIPEIKTTSKITAPKMETKNIEIPKMETKNLEIPKCQLTKINIRSFIYGYCFSVLRKGICYNQQQCRFKHELQDLLTIVCSKEPRVILDVVQDILSLGYNFFSTTVYVTSLQKLTVDQILIIYRIFIIREEITISSKKHVIQNIIKELLHQQLSLKTIVNHLIEPTKNSSNLKNILTCIEKYIKCGEYWNTVRALILRLSPDKNIVEKILRDCEENERLIDVQDINNNLISKLPHMLISILDQDILERFKNLVERTANNSRPAVQNFGENLCSETIASPDGSTSFSQTESPRRNSTFINKSINKKDYTTEVNDEEIYIMRPIDDLPDVRSVYRDHKHLWKFYVDLDRFKKGLLHEDYDYVISILKNYAEKQDESSLFVRSCCNILRTEIKRTEYHLRNIIRRTVQMGTFDILGKILFDIGLDILINLVDNEAWGLALGLIQSLNIHELPCNAEYFLLSAEIYLANKKAVRACDLLKYKNIICTSRDKWFVKSTINDERVRSKIMYILLDSFCNELIEQAFFLFQFLLKDQSSQYYPIDLSRYVDKLIMLFLSKKDTNLITEMANLVLKYTFALSTRTCRALTSTLIHMDENLAKQIYNYAEGIGIYPAVKLWPVTYIIMNTDLTEEEIYLIFLQLLKNLIINFGHTIEFAKPHQIKVYLILEVKLINEQFHRAELQNHNNNKAITNIKTLVRNVLKQRFDPPILLMARRKGRIYKLQSKSVINYLKTEHCK